MNRVPDRREESMSLSNATLAIEDIRLDVTVPSKRSALEMLSQSLGSRAGVDTLVVFDALWTREQLGSTGLGHGVALPHARLDVTAPVAAFMRPKQPIPFDAPDDESAAFVLGLLLPSRDPSRGLQLLAHVAQLFSEQRFRDGPGMCA
jgi:PTS system nitrogen regulatory IIA component